MADTMPSGSGNPGARGGGAHPATLRIGELSGECVFQVEDHITVDQFSELMAAFQRHGRHRHSQGTVAMPTDNFQALLSQTLHRPEGDERISLLCNKIDSGGDGVIQKDKFCSYFLQQLREKDSSNVHHLPFQEPPKFRHNMASKETLCRLMFSGPVPRYISISKDGGAGVWSSSLHFQRGFILEGSTDSHTVTRGTSGPTLWVTDCTLMADCNKLVISTTARELLFYDISTTIFTCQYQIHDCPSVVLCMTYHCSCDSIDSGGGSTASYLLYGDMSGSVSILSFTNPQTGLFVGGSLDDQATPQMIAYARLTEHAQCVTFQTMPQLHPDWVRRISYVWHNHSFISCSNSPINSLVMRDVGRKRKSYIFRVRKGVLCFDYSHQLEILVTGSIDHVVRLWNPYVPSKPMAVLKGHTAAVLDVVVASGCGLIFSYSHDALLCAWDLYEHVLVQKIHVRFPFSQRLPDYGPSVLTLHTSHTPTLVVVCNEYIAEFKVGATLTGLATGGGVALTSHAHPLSAAVYNPHLHQVVSGCEGGVVTIWDIDSGRQVLRFANCHGNNEITALCLDTTGRRLVTGSRDGDIKVWNCSNGSCLKHMAGDGYTEVTGVMHILEKSKFLSVGWNKRITTYLDEPDIFKVSPDNSWRGKETHHHDDILCFSYCPPFYLATGSFDGEIKVWNMDTEKVVSTFHSTTRMKPAMLPKMRKTSVSSQVAMSRRSSLNSSRPVSRRMSTYRMRSSSVHLHHVPVNQLLFLRSRLRGHQKGSATLVSSEGGVARFWDIFSPSSEPLGWFPLTESEEECVMALKTDPLERLLLAGDTAGGISIYDITNFCTTSHKPQETFFRPVSHWQAHSSEVVSIDYIGHEAQPLVLSASGDSTLRLWTLSGHYIGMFGQRQFWNLKNPSTFQHPYTPWGEVQCPPSHLPGPEAATQRLPSRATTPRPGTPGRSLKTHVLKEEEASYQIAASGSSSSASIVDNAGGLVRPLTDKSLGCNYNDSIHKRMFGRHERRAQYAEINTKATQRFGSLCSPYQALQLLNLEDVRMPQEMVSVVHQTES